MKKYEVNVTVTNFTTTIVEADNEDYAINIVMDRHKNDDHVVLEWIDELE